jgi:hypothetical protein
MKAAKDTQRNLAAFFKYLPTLNHATELLAVV